MANKRWSKQPSGSRPPTGKGASGDGISPKVKPVGYPGVPGKTRPGGLPGPYKGGGRAKFIVDSEGVC